MCASHHRTAPALLAFVAAEPSLLPLRVRIMFKRSLVVGLHVHTYHRHVTVNEIVGRLQQSPVFSIPEAKQSTGIPPKPGFYAWWCTPDGLTGVPTTPHPSQMLRLLYIGIAPRDAASSAQLRSRLCNQHIGGNVGSSTFRFGLAALLWQQERWTPRMSPSGKFKLDRDDNRALSVWQITHLQLRWAVASQPWDFENDVIAAMQPPPESGSQRDTSVLLAMGHARDRFRSAARTTVT